MVNRISHAFAILALDFAPPTTYSETSNPPVLITASHLAPRISSPIHFGAGSDDRFHVLSHELSSLDIDLAPLPNLCLLISD